MSELTQNLQIGIVLSMFMLSFIFVIVYGLFEWKQIYRFFLSFVNRSVLLLEILLPIGVGILLFSLTPPQYCACPKPEPGFPTAYVMVFAMFNDLRWEVIVHFRIVDHHCLSFLNIINFSQMGKSLILLKKCSWSCTMLGLHLYKQHAWCQNKRSNAHSSEKNWN